MGLAVKKVLCRIASAEMELAGAARHRKSPAGVSAWEKRINRTFVWTHH